MHSQTLAWELHFSLGSFTWSLPELHGKYAVPVLELAVPGLALLTVLHLGGITPCTSIGWEMTGWKAALQKRTWVSWWTIDHESAMYLCSKGGKHYLGLH